MRIGGGGRQGRKKKTNSREGNKKVGIEGRNWHLFQEFCTRVPGETPEVVYRGQTYGQKQSKQVLEVFLVVVVGFI